MNDVCHTVYIPREFLMLWPVFDNDDLLTAVCAKLLGLYVPVYYVLLYERKCKWSNGPSCPVDFPLNIFIHSFSTVGRWCGYLSGARCRLAYGPADATATDCLLVQKNPDWFYLSGTGPPG